jgi:nucleotide-binding universal stress UspA family protein
MFKNILLPVDLTTKNEASIRKASELAAPGATMITLLHVVETIRGVPFEELEDFYLDLQRKADLKLGELAKSLQGEAIEVRSVVRNGTRGGTIIEYADEEGSDLIILTSHKVGPDHPGGGLGTISHQVALLAGCPVLLLR